MSKALPFGSAWARRAVAWERTVIVVVVDNGFYVFLLIGL